MLRLCACDPLMISLADQFEATWLFDEKHFERYHAYPDNVNHLAHSSQERPRPIPRDMYMPTVISQHGTVATE